MKIFALLSLLFCLSVEASSSRVGDSATLVGTYSGQQIILKSEIAKYLANEGKYLVKNTTTVPGQGVFSEDILVTEDEMMTPEKGELILVMCSQVGGVVEEITLSMGKFSACKISVQDALNAGFLDVAQYLPGSDDPILNGALWLGKFPIQGVGRLLTNEQSMSLESFRWSK